jgi:hypothetical protein
MSGSDAKYDTWYTFQSSTTFWLSWSGLAKSYAYLYGEAKDMWFQKVGTSGKDKDAMLTGDQVWIFEKISAFSNYLMQPALGEYTRWTKSSSEAVIWQLWVDTKQTPGQHISTGQTLYLTNLSFSNAQVVQYPGDLQYLTMLMNVNPLTFTIQPKADVEVADESDDKTPPKFAKE